MSYEGFTQKICKNGHYWTEDCWTDDFSHRCPVCHAVCIWWNMVDETNGSHDEETGERIDGFIEPKVKSILKCECCSSVLETVYEVPKTGHQENGKKTKTKKKRAKV